MSIEAAKKIGKIADAHGIKGEISIFVFSGDVSWLKELHELFISRKGELEKHKILKKRAHKNGFVCLLENFEDRNKAEEYKGREVWIDSCLLVSKPGETLFLIEILGFEVVDSVQGQIGQISAFSSNGPQDLLVIKKENQKEIEIPFVKEFVQEMDFENKKILMNLPEGLLEINDAD